MTDRTDIIRRIKALMDRTMDRGCTEAEAMTAAALAAKLLSEHGLSMSDIQIKERTDCETGTIETGRKRAHEIQFCIVAIAKFCDCEAWGDHGNYKFFGFPEDVQVAIWLYHTIFNSMTVELSAFKKVHPVKGRGNGIRQSHAFLLGMARRVSSRLHEMKKAQTAETHETTGRDLVVVKNAVVKTQMADLNLNLRSNKQQGYSRDAHAYGAGQAAGSRVGLNRPIGKSSQALIGG